MKKLIVLTGFAGVGKTTVGRELARTLGMEFFDTDEVIEKEEGKTVAEIFREDGEEYFRGREADVFRRLMEKDSAVISTGGGAFENPHIRSLAKERAVSVCLVSSVEGLLKRTKQLKKRRPMLRNKTADEIKMLYRKRERCYAGCDVFVKVEGVRKTDVVKKILELLKSNERRKQE